MRLKQLTVVVLVFMLMASVFLNINLHSNTKAQTTPEVYIGIDVAYGDLDAVKELVDEVSTYTNLFIIGCTVITNYTAKLDETCQYLYDRGMSFIVYQEIPFGLNWRNFTVSNWSETAKNRWGEHFLGFYYMDEFGGKQLDMSSWSAVTHADNYTDMSNKFNERIKGYTDWFRSGYSDWTDVSLFMSDYALYWFDYKVGYDTLFAQFGWNYSRQLNAALCRGAATVQDKDWGIMITWTYTEPPYIESAEELYNDLLLAYDNGAKYIVVFDSNEEYTQGILTEEHLNALKQFWDYVQNNPREDNSVETRTAVVLPDNYAYGFRGPEDKIWGLWEADNISYALSVGVNNLLEQYGTKLDIIYDDDLEPGNTYGYSSFIYWNDTSQFPAVTPTPSPTQTAPPSPTPTLTATPSQTDSPTPTTSPDTTNTSNPTATSSQQPSPTQDSQDGQNMLPDYVYAVAAGGTIAAAAAIAVVLRRKR